MPSSGPLRTGTRYIAQHLKRARQIELSNVPPTATPADLRRFITRAQAKGVEDVSIEYNRLEPTGRAYLKLTHPDFLLPNLSALEKVTISGVYVLAEPSNRETVADLVNGNGLGSELKCDGKDVVVWGLPKAAGPEVLDELLDGFTFPPGEPYIFKLPPQPLFTLFSRFLVRLTSEEEAHRLVRQMHMSNFDPTLHGSRYTIRARVMY